MATSASVSPGSSTGINFSFVSQTMGTVLDTSEANLRDVLAKLGDAPTQSQLLSMQVDLQKWSMLVQLQSTITKELGDALKGIIQKSG